ncbi:MAG: cation:proton antiporter [Actinomycetota bacterium]
MADSRGGAPTTSIRRVATAYIALFLFLAVALLVFVHIGQNQEHSVSVSIPESGSGNALSPEEIFGRLMLAIAAVVLMARLLGVVASKIGQPRVMGEILAGIVLGPSVLGLWLPHVQTYLFHPTIVPLLGGAADIGLAFYMFLVGLELDPKMLHGRLTQAAVISNASVIVPLAVGVATATRIYSSLAPDGARFLPFALFVGVSMSITAFPVLARILIEERMLKNPVGAVVMASAAVDDVTAWALLALATALAGASDRSPLLIVALVILFCLAMGLVVRPLLARVSIAYDEAGHVPIGWITTIFMGVLFASFSAQSIGIAAIFGAFVMGLIMPRRADLTHDIAERIEDFVVTLLLPLFLVVTGLRTRIDLLNTPKLWAITAALIGVSIGCKWIGAMGAARFTGYTWRESAAIGALMNTRGLTELIVLNVALGLGIITPTLFSMLVLMALVTTFMTGPSLRLIDPKRSLRSAPEELLEEEPPRPHGIQPPLTRSILVAPQDSKNLDALLEIGAALSGSEPPRELLIARILAPSKIATGLASEDRELQRAVGELNARRASLLERGVQARAIAFMSPDPGEDLRALAAKERVDLVLVDGRRPLLGEGVPRGIVGMLLGAAECDVAILVEREGSIFRTGGAGPIAVPFGGAEHDWAALELGAWIAHAYGTSLRLLGAGPTDSTRDASRLLGNAALVVQRFAGISAEPRLADPGDKGVLDAAAGASLLVVGLSDRWRQEGLGPVRSAIARSAPVPVLFVRRGRRPGALAPRDDVTRFGWSRAATPGEQP